MKVSTVQHMVLDLAKRGWIRRFAVVNSAALGFIEFDVVVSLPQRSGELRDKFFQFLTAQNNVSYVVSSGGPFNCGFTLCAKSHHDAVRFMMSLNDRFPGAIAQHHISLCLGYTIFPPRYLSSIQAVSMPRRYRSEITVNLEVSEEEVDEIDLNVLGAVSKHPSHSSRELAQLLGLSPSTLSYRVNRLRSKKLFLGYCNAMHPHLYGFEHFHVHLRLEGLLRKDRDVLLNFAKSCRNLTYVVEWLGPWNFCLGITADSAATVVRVVDDLQALFGPRLVDTVLYPILRDVKMGASPSYFDGIATP